MDKIKFGTDGWRAIIGKEFTVENVARVTHGVAVWLKEEFDSPSVVVGHDCRFAGSLFVDCVVRILSMNNIKVYTATGVCTTPMISLAAKKLECSIGVIITASHNPASYNGYKLKGGYGGPLLGDKIALVEAAMPAKGFMSVEQIDSIEPNCEEVDLKKMYIDHIRASFDLDAIRNSGLKLAYDAMYGSGQLIMREILPELEFFRCEMNPSFMGISPEPIMRNLEEFSEFIKNTGGVDCALANDGDADRIALLDGKGNYIDSHHVMLLLIHYLCKYKKWTGKIATGFSTTVKMEKLCEHYGLEVQRVPIGFKHVCELMLTEDILMGGEESGGIAVKGHIPERDGIWNGLVIWEFLAKSGKTIEELIEEVYDIVGPFAFERIDLTLSQEQKDSIVAKCVNREYNSFGSLKVERLDDMDGYKYILNEHEWVMIRPSGTEPVLRTYAESDTQENALRILKETHDTIL